MEANTTQEGSSLGDAQTTLAAEDNTASSSNTPIEEDNPYLAKAQASASSSLQKAGHLTMPIPASVE